MNLIFLTGKYISSVPLSWENAASNVRTKDVSAKSRWKSFFQQVGQEAPQILVLTIKIKHDINFHSSTVSLSTGVKVGYSTD